MRGEWGSCRERRMRRAKKPHPSQMLGFMSKEKTLHLPLLCTPGRSLRPLHSGRLAALLLSQEMGTRLPRTGKPFLYAVLTSRGFQLKSIPKDRLHFNGRLLHRCRCHVFLGKKETISLPLYVLPKRICLPYFLTNYSLPRFL